VEGAEHTLASFEVSSNADEPHVSRLAKFVMGARTGLSVRFLAAKSYSAILKRLSRLLKIEDRGSLRCSLL
jgi:hypothetical protein